MLFANAQIATMVGSSPYGLVSDGAVVTHGSDIVWAGQTHDLPKQFHQEDVFDCAGRLVTPALIDCHTHLVFAGNRAREFEMRLQGASYEAIARAGGGILSTVEATRAADVDTLVALALPRLEALLKEGVTTVEIKSGYGLNLEAELNLLRAARKLGELKPVRVVTSFLGAHAVPPDYQNRADAYLDEVCLPALKIANEQGLVDAVDGFCEHIAFSAEQIERLFKTAADLNLPVKLHAEQLSHQGGTALAARYGALSADHVEYATPDDAIAMAASGTVATLLPGAFYTLHEQQRPPVAAFRKYGVPMAVATDANPGSSPLYSPLLAMNMACILFGLTPEEALRGVTCNAAKALGLENVGTLQPRRQADLAIWDADHPAELSYRMGFNTLFKRIYQGEVQP